MGVYPGLPYWHNDCKSKRWAGGAGTLLAYLERCLADAAQHVKLVLRKASKVKGLAD